MIWSLRTVGALLTAVSSAACGMLISVYYRRRLTQLSELIRFVEYIALEIECSGKTLELIYRDFEFSPVLSRFGEKLGKSGWREAMSELRLLDNGTYEALARFSASLGTSGKLPTLKLCGEISSIMRAEYEKSESGIDGRIKVMSSLCVSCGLMLALLGL